MAIYPDSRIAINAAERDTMHVTIVSAAQCGSADTAEAQAPPRPGFIVRQVFLTRSPAK